MSDLIDRQVAIKILRESEEYDADIPNRADGVRDAIIDIMSLPTIEERKTGKWIKGKCDQCGEHAPFWPMASTYYRSSFCPNCGARMEVAQ